MMSTPDGPRIAVAVAVPARPRSRWRRAAGPLAFAPPALLAFGLIANGAIQASGRRGNEASKIALAQLPKDLRATPFTVRLPTRLPGNARLIRTFLDKPDAKKGFQTYAFNTWYSTADDKQQGRVIHIWQTNDNFLARELNDPTKLKGTPEMIGTATWHKVVDDRVKGHWRTVYSRRFDDGVTVAVDAQNQQDATETIATLQETVKR